MHMEMQTSAVEYTTKCKDVRVKGLIYTAKYKTLRDVSSNV